MTARVPKRQVARAQTRGRTRKTAVEFCAPYCEPELERWARFMGAGYTDGTPEHFWWEVFDGIFQRMCKRAQRSRPR